MLNYYTLAQTDIGILTYFDQSNFAGKLIVIALIAFSFWAWTLMVGKYLELKRMQSLNIFLEEKLNKQPVVIDRGLEQSAIFGPFAALLKVVYESFYKVPPSGKTEGKSIIMSQIENGLQREVAKQSSRYESKMVMLGSIISGAPFLGLLGTVWGVMDAFGNIALQSSASLQNLAPGVSGALLTTVAALLVAIPSVFGYNFLVARTKQMIIDLENFASTLADRVELEIDR